MFWAPVNTPDDILNDPQLRQPAGLSRSRRARHDDDDRLAGRFLRHAVGTEVDRTEARRAHRADPDRDRDSPAIRSWASSQSAPSRWPRADPTTIGAATGHSIRSAATQSMSTRSAVSGCLRSHAFAKGHFGTTTRCSSSAQSMAAVTSAPPTPRPPSASGTPCGSRSVADRPGGRRARPRSRPRPRRTDCCRPRSAHLSSVHCRERTSPLEKRRHRADLSPTTVPIIQSCVRDLR